MSFKCNAPNATPQRPESDPGVDRELLGEGGKNEQASSKNKRQKPPLDPMTFTNTYINILHTTQATEEAGKKPHAGEGAALLPCTGAGAGLLGPHPTRPLPAGQIQGWVLAATRSLLSLSPPLPSPGVLLCRELVCPVRGSSVGSFGSLRLLLHGTWLTALARPNLGKGKGERGAGGRLGTGSRHHRPPPDAKEACRRLHFFSATTAGVFRHRNPHVPGKRQPAQSVRATPEGPGVSASPPPVRVALQTFQAPPDVGEKTAFPWGCL